MISGLYLDHLFLGANNGSAFSWMESPLFEMFENRDLSGGRHYVGPENLSSTPEKQIFA